MLKFFDYVLSLGSVLNGYKTLIGAALYLFSEVASHVPSLAGAYSSTLDSLQVVSEVLVSLGIIHWKIKDLLIK